MPASVKFKVNSISDGGNNQVNVAFQVSAQVQGTNSGGGFNLNLAFPAAEGKEFEVGDTYSIEIAPKPESAH